MAGQMTPERIQHILRNRWGWTDEEIHQAGLEAADEIDRLRARITQAERLLEEWRGISSPLAPGSRIYKDGVDRCADELDAYLRGESNASTRYRMHVTGPDYIQDFDSEIAALREANKTNKVWLRCQEECEWDENAPVVVAIVSPAPNPAEPEGESNG